MLDEMRALIKTHDMCVLATVSGTTPHCSLMGYVADEEARAIYMVSHTNTAKYRNMVENPAVSLLIDTRVEDRLRRERAKALTVTGVFERIEDPERRQGARARLLERQPHLKEFAEHSEAEVFSVRIRSLQLLDGVSDSYVARLD
jgi:nitroimidazol reductase NimA-like FMN-containing flavoprotein (pyridoxamine 5'-phosphate oxidase superfamily)